MGAVHRALDGETGRFVAVKRLLDPTHVSRFEIEARLLAQLDHPRVVRVVDHFRDSGDYYIVMELIEGESLHDRLAAEGTPGLPVDDIIEWGGQACEALDYIHQQHIVHRDVKPQNLIVADRGVVLVDFGVRASWANPRTGRSPSVRRASWRRRSSAAARSPSAPTSSASP